MQYEIHKDRSEQAVTALCLARAEVNLRRRAMLEEADRLWYRNTGLDSEGVSSKEITAEW